MAKRGRKPQPIAVTLKFYSIEAPDPKVARLERFVAVEPDDEPAKPARKFIGEARLDDDGTLHIDRGVVMTVEQLLRDVPRMNNVAVARRLREAPKRLANSFLDVEVIEP